MEKVLSLIFNPQKILKNTEILGPIPERSDLLKRTLSIAWPSMIESFLLALVAFMDTLMVSTLGDYAVAAVGLTNQPRLLCLAIFFALSTAVSALVARRKGEDDRASAVKILKLSLVVAFLLTALISVLAFVFAGNILKLVGSQPDTHEYAVDYFRIIVCGFFFNALSMVINAAQRGSGNTKIAMKTNIVNNAVNIFFNYLLIGGNFGFPRLGVKGAAIATFLGAMCAFVMAVISIFNRDSYVCILLSTKHLSDKRSSKSMLSITMSAFAEQLFLRFGFIVNAAIIARLGTLAFTTHQIANNFMMISFAFGDGLSVAAVALVGYSLGEKRQDMAKLYGSFCQRCGVICSAVLFFVYTFFGRQLYSLFSSDEYVIKNGTIIMILMPAIVLFQISQVIYMGCLRGSGDTKFTAFVSFINIGILRPGLCYLFAIVLDYGIVGAWAGVVIDQLVRLLLTSTRFRSEKWMKLTI